MPRYCDSRDRGSGVYILVRAAVGTVGRGVRSASAKQAPVVFVVHGRWRLAVVDDGHG